jgi:hypothetical protein
VIKAELHEIDRATRRPKPRTRVVVQFNPETLKVTYANSVLEGDNALVGAGMTRLEMQLWFDVTGELSPGLGDIADVRQLTRRVAYFITPQPDPADRSRHVLPLVRFIWGTFQFDGVIESLEETLEFFSPEGRPLRAGLELTLSSNWIQFQFASSGVRSGT